MAEYTVVGFLDESGDVQVAGVIEGDHPVTQTYYDRWWVVTEASSPGQAEELAVSKIEKEKEADT